MHKLQGCSTRSRWCFSWLPGKDRTPKKCSKPCSSPQCGSHMDIAFPPNIHKHQTQKASSFFFPSEVCPSADLVVMLDDLPSFPTQSIPSREILCHTILGGHSTCPGASSTLVETVPPVVVLHVVVGIDVDAIVHLGLIAQLGRHCLKAWTCSKA